MEQNWCAFLEDVILGCGRACLKLKLLMKMEKSKLAKKVLKPNPIV